MNNGFDNQLCPRVKSIYPVYKLREGLFRIGSQRGLTKQYKDPENELWELIQ